MEKSEKDSPKLVYFGTDIEVKIGDKVKMKRLILRDRECVVCYIPGVSEKHSEIEYEDVQQWGVKDSEGAVWLMAYEPNRYPAPKNIVFVSRGDEPGIKPDYFLA